MHYTGIYTAKEEYANRMANRLPVYFDCLYSWECNRFIQCLLYSGALLVLWRVCYKVPAGLEIPSAAKISKFFAFVSSLSIFFSTHRGWPNIIIIMLDLSFQKSMARHRIRSYHHLRIKLGYKSA